MWFPILFFAALCHFVTGQATETPVIEEGQYIGCLDNVTKMKKDAKNFEDNSPKMCAKHCKTNCSDCDALGLNDDKCFCTKIIDLTKLTHSSRCTLKCPGSKSDICGSIKKEGSLSFFRIKYFQHDVWQRRAEDSSIHYKLFRYKNPWSYAQKLCRSKGAGLAEKLNERDLAFLLVNVVGTLDSAWVGAKRKGDDFKWVGSEETLHKDMVKDGAGDCVYLEGQTLRTGDCETKMAFLCQADTDYSKFMPSNGDRLNTNLLMRYVLLCLTLYSALKS